MLRPIHLALGSCLVFAMLATGVPSLAGEPVGLRVKTRMTGWVSMADGYFVYRRGDTAGIDVGVWPSFPREPVKARLEWRDHGKPWHLLDVSRATLNRDSQALFKVRRIPAGFEFRIQIRIGSTDEHRAGRSAWSYFEAR
ncbi:MAG: hypothetical protein ACXWZF_03670 [Actinomycetota bacterium]